MKANLDKLWAAEYSVSAKCFHIDLLDSILRTNARMAASEQSSDYQIFGVFETSQEANDACDKMTEKQHKDRKHNKQKARL